MNMRSSRGEVATAVLLYVVLGLALTQLVPNWRITKLWQKGPPTAELNVAQQNLDKAKKEEEAAEAKLKAALAEQAAKTQTQVQGAQEYVEGARSSLDKAPRSPEVSLASGLLDRASISLRNAIGDLPKDRQLEIVSIVDGALSQKQDEIDAANELLAERDAQNEALQAQKLELAAQIPALEKKVALAETKVASVQEVVTAKTNEVVAYAATSAAKDKEAGSLGAFINRLWKALAVVAALAAALFLLYLYTKFRSVGAKTLGTIIGDIRSGIEPTVAFDTNLRPSLHPIVKKQSIATVAANTTP